MKVNKWTLGLAAVGLVSLPSMTQAEEKASTLMTALSSTTISGYVDTSIQWDPGTGNANPPGFIYNSGKQDGFNLNKVKLRIERPLDEAQWAAGYRVDLLFGPDANTFATSSSGTSADFAIQQAYVSLRAPVGNGLDFKLGVFDGIIGYESHDSVNNPNYTRSYGTTIEPHTHTGLLATYQVSDMVRFAAGIANTFGPAINERANPPKAESYKTYMAAVSLTAPESFGYAKGATLDAGVVNGANKAINGGTTAQTSFYTGVTVPTPVTALKVGASYDYAGVNSSATTESTYANVFAWYASYQATDKLSFHGRGEYLWQNNNLVAVDHIPSKVFAATGTVQYDLWKNVLSRLEIRWDHSANGQVAYGGGFAADGDPLPPTKKNAVLIAANVIYKF